MAKAKQPEKGISPTREENYPDWYQQVVRAADLAESSVVRGCMVIKPWGYAIWENMQRVLDAAFKATGHRNAYFPLFIPKSLLEKEAAHVEGFAKECAIVTHHRLVAGPSGGLIADPEAALEEPLVVRPTSETIIGASFAQWIHSYRDLPLLINQWANVVRWELRTRLFLRTAEFLWQEGHTAHASSEDAMEETMRMLGIYQEFAEKTLAMPVVRGRKTALERFPGAVDTFCIEAMMQDRKALQAGTSHFLGQNFAKAADIKFQAADETEQYAWTTSWGVSTRLVGALIMTHSDDDGLVLPPRVAPAQVALMPILRDDGTRAAVLDHVERLTRELRAVRFGERPIDVEVDLRDIRGGEKNWSWIKRGVPIRLEIGPRDAASDAVTYARRDEPARDKHAASRAEFLAELPSILGAMQQGLFDRALAFQQAHTHEVDDWAELERYFTPKDPERPEIHGGFAMAHWCGAGGCEERMHDIKVTIRSIPLEGERQPGGCVVCGQPSERRVLCAKSY